MKKKFNLNEDWKFCLSKNIPKDVEIPKSIKKNKWNSAQVPGTIHTDLLIAELIPEPFYSDNELQLQWIGELDWVYKTTFDYPKDFDNDLPVSLIFEGIDTVAEIKLNDKSIGSVNNMFCMHQFDVTKLLHKQRNHLEINFKSPYRYARALETKHGKIPVELNSERVFIRKAQYSFGWDWGPSFATSGIWRPVYLEQANGIKINNIFFNTLSVENNSAYVSVISEFDTELPENHKLKITINDDSQSFEKLLESNQKQELECEIKIDNPDLWWPNNYGEQHLYNCSLTLLDENENVIDELNKKVGIRTIELKLKEEDEQTFQFVVNGKPIYAKGVNWIPADSFLPRISENKYRNLLKAAKDGNMNIVRDWGGGVYEDNAFYEICDELGLMVWQDFMFACASYPEYEEFLLNVKEEVEQNVKRLQYHPSIVIWCGNNENEWIWTQQQKTSYKEMPGYKIYHELIPSVLEQLDPQRPYWPSSPFSGEDEPNSQKSGNRHQWEIWSMWKDYKKVVDDESLFVTEFGFQSCANFDTFIKVLPEEQRNSQSRIFEYHNKQVEGPERLFKFLSGHLPVKTDLKDFIYLTQLNQGFALKECVEHWQSRFPKSNGSIIWQINDCWPVSSWSLIDSDLRPKLSYFKVKRAFNPQLLLLEQKDKSLNISVMNNTLNEFKGAVQLFYVPIPNGKIEHIGFKKIKLTELSNSIITSIAITEKIEKGEAVVVASLLDENDNLINRNYFIAQEWKHVKLPEVKLNLKYSKKENLITVETNRPAFFVDIQNPNLSFQDNGFIILPDEEFKIQADIIDPKESVKKTTYKCLNEYLL